MRGRVVRALKKYDELALGELGSRVRVDYGGAYGREWLGGLLDDLEDEGLVTVDEGGGM